MIHYPKNAPLIHPSWNESYRKQSEIDLAALAAGGYSAQSPKVDLSNVFKIGDLDHPILTDYERKLFKDQLNKTGFEESVSKDTPASSLDDFWEHFMNPKLPVLTQETQVTLWSTISKYNKPTDSIVISEEDATYFASFWRNKEVEGIPADIIFAKTLPMTNFEVTIKSDLSTDAVNYAFRAIMFDGWEASVDEVMKNPELNGGIIGVFMMTMFRESVSYVYAPITIKHGDDCIFYAGVGWHYAKTKDLHKFKHPGTTSYMIACLETAMTTMPQIWYGLELSMLNPMTVEVFQNPKTEVYSSGVDVRVVPNGKKRRRQVTYVRKHVIPNHAVQDAMTNSPLVHRDDNTTHRTFTRRTLAWYVIGHWRKTRDGKTFIRGHWRGPLRQVKQNLDEGRDRKIPFPEKQDS